MLLTAVFLPLSLNRRREQEGSLFNTVTGPVQGRHLLPLLAMPVVATAVYKLAAILDPPAATIRAILELKPMAQALVGALLFLWAIVATIHDFYTPTNAHLYF